MILTNIDIKGGRILNNMTVVDLDKLTHILTDHFYYSDKLINDLKYQLEQANAIKEISLNSSDDSTISTNSDKLIHNERYHLTELLAVERNDIIRSLAQRCIDPEHHRFNNSNHRDCKNCRFSKVDGYFDVVCCDGYKIAWLKEKIEED